MLPKEVLARLAVSEGDTIVVTETTENGVLLRSNQIDFAKKMAAVDDLAKRYRNTLRKLAK